MANAPTEKIWPLKELRKAHPNPVLRLEALNALVTNEITGLHISTMSWETRKKYIDQLRAEYRDICTKLLKHRDKLSEKAVRGLEEAMTVQNLDQILLPWLDDGYKLWQEVYPATATK